MLVYHGNRRRTSRSSRPLPNQKEDRLVKITLIQSFVTIIAVAGFFVYSLFGGVTLEDKQSMQVALTEHMTTEELATEVGSIFGGIEDSYLGQLVEQVINLYREPVEVTGGSITDIPVGGGAADTVLEASPNTPDLPKEPEQAADEPKPDADEPLSEPAAGETTDEPKSSEAVGIKLVGVDGAKPIANTRNVKVNLTKEVVNGGMITSGFGFRIHPITGKQDYHTGVDIGATAGTAIHTPFDGRVVTVGVDYAYGNFVVVDHGDGLMTYYSHCQSIVVKLGQVVKKGQTVAKVGNTGLSTGPHLHFEIMIEGSYVDPQNPDKGWEVI